MTTSQMPYSSYNTQCSEDHFTFLHNINWEDYQRLLTMRGDFLSPHINFLEGEIEFMSPSVTHEDVKSKIGCLIEIYCLERGIPFRTLGSWTLQTADRLHGLEPDECYIFGTQPATTPHLAIEVVWTGGRIDKLKIYSKLGVAEVWFWRQGHIQPYGLRGEKYVPLQTSEILPGLDLKLLNSFIDQPTTYDAIRGFREAIKN